MERPFYSKIITWILVGLLVLSVLMLVWGFAVGFNDTAVNVLLGWAYTMLGLAIAAVVLVGLYVMAKNNPKSLVKIVYAVVGVGAVCLIAYLLAPGTPAVGLTAAKLPTASELKLTDTMLNLTYFLGVGAIVAIVAGEIIMSLRGKKA